MEKDLNTIIEECRRGEMDNFSFVFEVFGRKIYNFIYFRTHHKETAEDITSLVFMKALENIQSYKPDLGSFSTWLYQIARNSIIDHYRTLKHADNIEDAWDISANVNIERDVDTAAQLEKVQAYLKTLPVLQRDIVIMRVWDSLSHQEIADILGITEASSKMNYSRTLAKISKEAILAITLLVLISLR